VLIPAIGLWKTAALAGFLDLAVAAIVTRRRPEAPPAETAAPQGGDGPVAGSVLMGRLIVPLFALSGFTAILAEIAWTRILSVPLGGMVYALSAILAIYLLGLALGSAAAARILRTFPVPILLFGIVELLLAALVVGGGHLFGRIPLWQARIISGSPGIAGLLAGDAAIAALFVLPPTLALGALFARGRDPPARGVREPRSGPCAANTVGSIAGSLLTGFVLLPWIDAQGAAAGAAISRGDRPRRDPSRRGRSGRRG
jgi:spermidine synthase